MIISLTGFMGCGKSSVGKELSALLCCDFVDLDKEIEVFSGMSIPRIFEEKGEGAFREIELRVLEEVLGREDDFVLALGGGTVTIPEAAEMIHARTRCFYLSAGAAALEQWLREDGTAGRPMLSSHSVAELLEKRIPVYSDTAHYVIDVEGKSYGQIASLIVEANNNWT